MNIAEQFQQDRYAYIENVITPERASELTQHLFDEYQKGNSTKEDQCPKSNSFYNAPLLDKLHKELTEQLNDILDLDLEPSYCYARIYRPGEELHQHTDREACEISGTLTLGHDPDSDIWPFYIGEDIIDNVGKPLTINIGDMVMYHGMELNHWREKYTGQWQTQVFFHYVKKDGAFKEHAGDKVRVPKDTITEGLKDMPKQSVYLFEAGEHVKTNVQWEVPNIKTFKKFLNQEFLPTMPKGYEAFLVGSFPHTHTWDIDIFIIGKPTDEVALWVIDMYNKSLNDYKQLIDISMFDNLNVFNNYDLFNKTKDPSVLVQADMYRTFDKLYRNGRQVTSIHRKVTKISDVLYRHHTSEEVPNRKFLQKNFHQPMDLKRFNEVYNV